MLGFVLNHNPCNARSYHELRRSHNTLHEDLLLPSVTALSNICRMKYARALDAIKKQLPSRNVLRSALDRWRSTNKRTITSVSAYYMDRNWALRDVQLAFDEVDRLFLSCFES